MVPWLLARMVHEIQSRVRAGNRLHNRAAASTRPESQSACARLRSLLTPAGPWICSNHIVGRRGGKSPANTVWRRRMPKIYSIPAEFAAPDDLSSPRIARATTANDVAISGSSSRIRGHEFCQKPPACCSFTNWASTAWRCSGEAARGTCSAARGSVVVEVGQQEREHVANETALQLGQLRRAGANVLRLRLVRV